jgi:Transposase and inactivated derivatives, IS30 family
LFKEYGLDVFALRRYVSRKIPKAKKNLYKKRTDWKFLKNRTFNDFKELLNDNPNLKIAQMDTVYNDVSNGPFIQTIKILNLPVLIAIFHKEKTAKAMVDGLNLLEEKIGTDLFKKYIDVITPDRGSEFFDAEGLETSMDGTCRCKIYYCDPMQSHQKASLENNHEDLRYVLPKEKNLEILGLTSQEKLNIVLSHINSYPKEKLNGKTPIELVKFLAPDLAEKLESFGIKQIPKDKIILNPALLKK